jgi:hypothetical protein
MVTAMRSLNPWEYNGSITIRKAEMHEELGTLLPCFKWHRVVCRTLPTFARNLLPSAPTLKAAKSSEMLIIFYLYIYGSTALCWTLASFLVS